ncbi:MAG: hypothetical protein U5K36_01605 [Roseovarius sp.]|nr:hypothetical protein [Roseovarius sp.]
MIDGFAERRAAASSPVSSRRIRWRTGASPCAATSARAARGAAIAGRVHFVRGGKLAQLLDDARSAVTVNSTAGQQVLWRGIPLKVFGDAVYAKPEFVSDQPLAEFFAAPRHPDRRAYDAYRRYLLETSQVPGGFYSARGRRQLLRQVVDMMLAPDDPYDALAAGTAAPRQQLRLVADDGKPGLLDFSVSTSVACVEKRSEAEQEQVEETEQ